MKDTDTKDILENVEQKNELRVKENKIRNHQILNEYYNSIKNKSVFENAVLNNKNDLYYTIAIKEHTEFLNNILAQNELLKDRFKLLKSFNFQIKLMMKKIVLCYIKVVEWQKTNNNLHENYLDISFACSIQQLKNEFPQSIRYNYAFDPQLAFRLKEYCLNSFDIMIAFLKNELLIDIEKSPLFPQIQELVNEFEKTIDVDKMKVLATPIPETEQPLDKIRINNYSNLELITLLKKLSNNYENDLLKALLKDIDFYLFVEKEEKESEFSPLYVENAIQKLIENNIEIPYYRRTPFEELTVKGKELAKKLKENGFTFAPTINKEQLLYPYEFYDIYRFKNLVISKLKEFNTIEPTPVKEQNPFDKIFTGSDNKTFVLFETFAKRHVIDKYIDFSFIFQQMKFNGYITDIKHIKFMDWLHQKDYLTDDEYSDFKVEKCFRSLKKCSFGTRVDLYLKLQNDIILSNSDLSE